MVDQTSQFYAILTKVGAAKQANADALGIAWKITQMAVGDGNPTGLEDPPLPMPDASARSLLNEWRRAPLNQLKVDDRDDSVIVAEQVIPADVGGRWIRELALYDADGDMVAIANCPPTYKPLLSQNAGRTQVVRMNLIVSSSSNVQLKIDPSVVLATREWVTEELAKQDFKHSVAVATTAPIALSGLQTLDGVALTAGVRVLVKNQAAAKDNGLYLVVAGGAWTRCPDADTSAKVTPGMLVLVERGTVNADSAWQLVTDGPITLGVSALTYEMAFGRTGVVAGIYRSVSVDTYGRVIAATNPTTVAGYGLTDVYTKTQIDAALALKASLAGATFTADVLGVTAPQFDSSKKFATTEFVRAAGGNHAGLAALAASTTLTAANTFGMSYVLNSPTAFTITLPRANTAFAGAAVTFVNTGLGAVTIKLPASDAISGMAGASFGGSVILKQFDTLVLSTGGGVVWYAEGGTVRDAQSSAITALMGNFNGVLSITDTTVLTAAHCGVQLIGSAGLLGKAITLPANADVPVGAVIRFSAGAADVTIQSNGGESIAPNPGGSGGVVQSFVMASYDSVVLVNLGSVWRMVGGSQQNKHTSMFGIMSSPNGYQRLPSGLIVQWGSGSQLAPSATGAFSLPVTFPTAFLKGIAFYDSGIGATATSFTVNRLSTSQIEIKNWSAGGVTPSYLAIGY